MPEFHEWFQKLPADIKKQARKDYKRFVADPDYPGLNFERLKTKDPFWSVRIGLHYRAVGLRQGDTIYWVFIGSHADYDKYLRHL